MHTSQGSTPYRSFIFTRRFFPLFWVQFLGAFNDNVFKNAIVMLITFKFAQTGTEAGLLVTLAAGIFIVPFFLFSAFAGIIADTYDKALLIKLIKFSEVLIMILGAWALVSEDLTTMFVVLFLMGLQSAFFGPIKYSILPDLLTEDELLQGNGWFSASTFLAILLGTLVAGILVLSEAGISELRAVIIGLAILGFLASFWVPSTPIVKDKPKLSFNFLALTLQEVRLCRRYPQAFFAVLFISWFWFLGATYLSQMPVIVKDIMGGEEKVLLLFLTVFSIGIAIGAVIVSRLNRPVRHLNDVLSNGYYLVGMTLLMWLSNALMTILPQQATPLLLSDFVTQWVPMLILICFGLIAVLGGIFIVPLYTLLQVQTPQGSRSRTVAVNNITNAVFMVLSAVIIMLLYAAGLDTNTILLVVSLLNITAIFGYFKMGRPLTRSLEQDYLDVKH